MQKDVRDYEPIQDMKECEHIKINNLVMGFPDQNEIDCEGYINPYTKNPSNVCSRCKFFRGVKENE